ncbi:hypothetical protein SLEP1_g35470 [Rubroshorea leprosula]|nr:hypothetical protein SLEP1_g35470 [Rubroshorea leprosula]
MQALAARPGGSPFLCIIGEQLKDSKAHMFNCRVGEALAVNAVSCLHRVPGNCLGNVLAMIRDQAVNIVTLVEKEASHNGPYLLRQRAKVEQYIFAPEMKNIVAYEGPERIERHERLDKWRKRKDSRGCP